MNVHKGWAFPRGIYSEVHSPITTPEIICVMALTLQPIRGCPQHSGETGTRLSSAIHRHPLSRFFLREGDVCTQANSLGLVDFAIGLGNSVLNLSDWENSNYRLTSCKQSCWSWINNKCIYKFFAGGGGRGWRESFKGKMTLWLVNASSSKL